MEKDRCNGCKSAIHSKNHIICPTCNEKYDLQCANISPKRYKAMNQESKRKWRCDECRSKQPKYGNASTPLRTFEKDLLSEGSSIPDLPEPSYVTSRRKEEQKYITEDRLLELMSSENSAMRSTIESSAKGLSDQLKYLNEQWVDSKDSISFVSQQFEDMKNEIIELKKIFRTNLSEVKQLREENNILREDIRACVTRIKVLEEENLKQQQWARLQNLEIVGIPENKDENTIETVLKISDFVGANIQPMDIEFAHRVQPRRTTSATSSRNIIVHLKLRTAKDCFLAAARKHRNLTTKDVDVCREAPTRIFINEHLTKENKFLLSACKQKVKEHNYKYIWTKNCRIYVRRNESSPPVLIASAADLIKIA